MTNSAAPPHGPQLACSAANCAPVNPASPDARQAQGTNASSNPTKSSDPSADPAPGGAFPREGTKGPGSGSVCLARWGDVPGTGSKVEAPPQTPPKARLWNPSLKGQVSKGPRPLAGPGGAGRWFRWPAWAIGKASGGEPSLACDGLGARGETPGAWRHSGTDPVLAGVLAAGCAAACLARLLASWRPITHPAAAPRTA